MSPGAKLLAGSLVLAAGLAAGLGVGPRGAAAQGLSARVAAAGGDAVAFRFDLRPDVRLCESGSVRVGRSTMRGRWREGDDRCAGGTAEVVLTSRDGRVRTVEVGPPFEELAARYDAAELGRVDAAEAADYLLSFAREGMDDRVAEEALGVAVLADAETWPRLLEVARDRSLDDDVRKAALFWTGQAAAERVTAELAGIASSEDEEQGVRDAAVFALSRRPEAESVPVLMEIARTAPHGKTRQTAMFWLARADDPRVVTFFEDILLGRRDRGG